MSNSNSRGPGRYSSSNSGNERHDYDYSSKSRRKNYYSSASRRDYQKPPTPTVNPPVSTTTATPTSNPANSPATATTSAKSISRANEIPLGGNNGDLPHSNHPYQHTYSHPHPHSSSYSHYSTTRSRYGTTNGHVGAASGPGSSSLSSSGPPPASGSSANPATSGGSPAGSASSAYGSDSSSKNYSSYYASGAGPGPSTSIGGNGDHISRRAGPDRKSFSASAGIGSATPSNTSSNPNLKPLPSTSPYGSRIPNGSASVPSAASNFKYDHKQLDSNLAPESSNKWSKSIYGPSKPPLSGANRTSLSGSVGGRAFSAKDRARGSSLSRSVSHSKRGDRDRGERSGPSGATGGTGDTYYPVSSRHSYSGVSGSSGGPPVSGANAIPASSSQSQAPFSKSQVDRYSSSLTTKRFGGADLPKSRNYSSEEAYPSKSSLINKSYNDDFSAHDTSSRRLKQPHYPSQQQQRPSQRPSQRPLQQEHKYPPSTNSPELKREERSKSGSDDHVKREVDQSPAATEPHNTEDTDDTNTKDPIRNQDENANDDEDDDDDDDDDEDDDEIDDAVDDSRLLDPIQPARRVESEITDDPGVQTKVDKAILEEDDKKPTNLPAVTKESSEEERTHNKLVDESNYCKFPLNKLDAELYELKDEFEKLNRNENKVNVHTKYAQAKPIINFYEYSFFSENFRSFIQKKDEIIAKLIQTQKQKQKRKIFLWKSYKDQNQKYQASRDKMDQQLKLIHPADDESKKELEAIDIRPKNQEHYSEAHTPVDVGSGVPGSGGGRRNRRHGDLVTTEAEFQEILKSLGKQNEEDPVVKAEKVAAKIPEMIFDPIERENIKYMDSNNIVTDRVEWKKRVQTDFENNFSEREQDLFVEGFCRYPKRFGAISRFMGGLRTAEECVVHYYRTKKDVNYKYLVAQFKKKSNKKAGRRGKNTKSRNVSQNSTPVTTPSTESNKQLTAVSKDEIKTTADDGSPPIPISNEAPPAVPEVPVTSPALNLPVPPPAASVASQDQVVSENSASPDKKAPTLDPPAIINPQTSSDSKPDVSLGAQQAESVLYTPTGRRKRGAAPSFDEASKKEKPKSRERNKEKEKEPGWVVTDGPPPKRKRRKKEEIQAANEQKALQQQQEQLQNIQQSSQQQSQGEPATQSVQLQEQEQTFRPQEKIPDQVPEESIKKNFPISSAPGPISGAGDTHEVKIAVPGIEDHDSGKRRHISSYWSITEANQFPALLMEFGTKWTNIADKLASKSATMVRNYYSRNAEKNGWIPIAEQADARLAAKYYAAMNNVGSGNGGSNGTANLAPAVPSVVPKIESSSPSVVPQVIPQSNSSQSPAVKSQSHSQTATPPIRRTSIYDPAKDSFKQESAPTMIYGTSGYPPVVQYSQVPQSAYARPSVEQMAYAPMGTFQHTASALSNRMSLGNSLAPMPPAPETAPSLHVPVIPKSASMAPSISSMLSEAPSYQTTPPQGIPSSTGGPVGAPTGTSAPPVPSLSHYAPGHLSQGPQQRPPSFPLPQHSSANSAPAVHKASIMSLLNSDSSPARPRVVSNPPPQPARASLNSLLNAPSSPPTSPKLPPVANTVRANPISALLSSNDSPSNNSKN